MSTNWYASEPCCTLWFLMVLELFRPHHFSLLDNATVPTHLSAIYLISLQNINLGFPVGSFSSPCVSNVPDSERFAASSLFSYWPHTCQTSHVLPKPMSVRRPIPGGTVSGVTCCPKHEPSPVQLLAHCICWLPTTPSSCPCPACRYRLLCLQWIPYLFSFCAVVLFVSILVYCHGLQSLIIVIFQSLLYEDSYFDDWSGPITDPMQTHIRLPGQQKYTRYPSTFYHPLSIPLYLGCAGEIL